MPVPKTGMTWPLLPHSVLNAKVFHSCKSTTYGQIAEGIDELVDGCTVTVKAVS